jgi:hypothetical protein
MGTPVSSTNKTDHQGNNSNIVGNDLKKKLLKKEEILT